VNAMEDAVKRFLWIAVYVIVIIAVAPEVAELVGENLVKGKADANADLVQ